MDISDLHKCSECTANVKPANRMEHTVEVEPPEGRKVEGPIERSEDKLVSHEYHNGKVDERSVGDQTQAFWTRWKSGQPQVDGNVTEGCDNPPDLVRPTGMV